MQVCTSLQTDDHANTPPLSFLQSGRPSCRPTNNVKALKGLPLAWQLTINPTCINASHFRCDYKVIWYHYTTHKVCHLIFVVHITGCQLLLHLKHFSQFYCDLLDRLIHCFNVVPAAASTADKIVAMAWLERESHESRSQSSTDDVNSVSYYCSGC